LNVLDLFSGIGGFSLGLERAGFTTVAFCEIDPYCRRVLARHWPDVPVYDDVRTLTAKRLVADAERRRCEDGEHRMGSSSSASRSEWCQQADGSARSGCKTIDVICGGFPCQDISTAGKGAGITGERSGLWREYARIIGEVRPRYVIVENVAALLHRGLADVLGDLAALGYDAEWHCIPASAVGAPHRRDRIWIVAYPSSQRCDGVLDDGNTATRLFRQTGRSGSADDVADTYSEGKHAGAVDAEMAGTSQHLAYPAGGIRQREAQRQAGHAAFGGEDVADADQPRLEGWLRAALSGRGAATGHAWAGNWWLAEPDVGRVAHGVPARVDRLRALGNAVVPQIPEIIGRAIMKAAQ
jgi:DNA (cytosine-5)-methyltransferase 1